MLSAHHQKKKPKKTHEELKNNLALSTSKKEK